ncbi:MAG: hypothetical protein ACRD88_12215 [Terriglobia bacterium]
MTLPWLLRDRWEKLVFGLSPTEAMELLLDRLSKVKSNADFLNSMSTG